MLMMKKIIFALLVFILIPVTVLAWDDCAKGEVLCEGKCELFVDTDNDEICDHSQPAPENRDVNVLNAKTEEEIHGLISGKDLKTKTASESDNNKNKRVYHLLPILLFLIVLYIISHVLSKKKIISIVNHRKIWNVLLLVTFLISGILGILSVIRINFGIAIPLPFNILFWHVEIGIAMFIICIFHIIEHWYYFKNLFAIRK